MYLIYGIQKSGLSIVNYFENKKIKFKMWDDNPIVRKAIKKNYNKDYFFNIKKDNLNDFKKIFVSPGISLRQKKFKRKNISKKVNRDLNLYISNLTNQKIVAITGTNGKSTTTKLIGSLCNAFLLKKKYKVHVIELSSFQLETVKSLDSRISVITNLSGDHLDRYKGISDYVSQKKNIITKNGINLLSIDDIYSRKIFNQKKIKNKISFSLVDKSADCFANNDYILDNYFKKNKKLFIKKISKDLEGNFNIQNILIAYICSKILKIPESNFLKVIKTFKGLPFRSSTIFTNNKLKIVNNSKSTNLNSTINSVVNYNNIYLILGGIAKEKNFEILLKYKNKISCVYTYGKSGNFIEKKLKKELVVKKMANLKSVIKETFKDIKKKSNQSTILFAPACASYDQYKNFEERGIHFNKLIKNYIN
jgi:UDP-N-acetylmuramoylalanine--D-glutamate ligase